jgi:Flp pilus assembly protein TadD
MSASRSRGSRRPAPAPSRPSHHRLFLLILIAAGIVTYWNSLHGPFIWDDQTSILTNPTIERLWPLTGPLSAPAETPVARRPIVNLTFALTHALVGKSETGYHIGNIAIHIACALLLFGIVRRTLVKLGGMLSDRSAVLALMVSLLWMLHPLQSEVVNYITQRSESLMAFCFELTLYAAIRGRGQAPTGRKLHESRPENPQRWPLLSIAACACGMMCKESMIVAPIVVALYDRVFEFPSLAAALRARRWLYTGLATTWAIPLVFIVTVPRSTVGASATVGPWTYLLNQAQMISTYLRLSVWPTRLVIDYGVPQSLSLGAVVPSAALVVVFVAATGFALARFPRAGFLGAAFLLTLAPTSSVIPILSEVGAERRMYLPFTALATLAVVGACVWLDRAKSHSVRSATESRPSTLTRWQVAAAGATLILVALAATTIRRNSEYQNPLTLWQTNVERRPHGRARLGFATELLTAGQHEEGLRQLRMAIGDFPDARAALGTELVLQGQTDEGIKVLREFISTNSSLPNRIPAHVLLAHALTSTRQLDEADAEWRAILTISPSDAGARQNLALTLTAQANESLERRDAEQAERYAREAVQMQPGNATARNLLGVALASKGHLLEALVQFREAVQIAPNDTEARANLERALRVTGAAR